MRNWDTRDESGTDDGCEWKKDWEDVQRVCQMLGLKCEMVRGYNILVRICLCYDTRLISRANTGLVFLSLLWACGRLAIHRILTYGVTGALVSPARMRPKCVELRVREVKFGALMDKLTHQNSWLATGESHAFALATQVV